MHIYRGNFYIFDRFNCHFLEICDEEIIFYSTSSQIVSNSSASIPITDSVLEYDRHNRRLLYYSSDTDDLRSTNLNGMHSTILLNNANVAYFAYDGKRGVLYYLHRFTLEINSVNITSAQDAPVQALNSLSGINGLKIDLKNE